MVRPAVSPSVVKWSEGLINMAFIIIRKYIDHRGFAATWLFRISQFYIFFGSNMYHFVYGCIFCVLIFNFANYVLLFLCSLIFIVT